MAICKHCNHETTLQAGDELTCPVCGVPYEFNEDDWNLEESTDDDQNDQTLNLAGEQTPASDSAGSESAEGTAGEMDFDVEATQVFGGMFPGGATADWGSDSEDNVIEDDDDGEIEFALGESMDDLPDDTANDAANDASGKEANPEDGGLPGREVTQAFTDPPQTDSPADSPKETRHNSPEMTQAFDSNVHLSDFDFGSESGSESGIGSDSGPELGSDSGTILSGSDLSGSDLSDSTDSEQPGDASFDSGAAAAGLAGAGLAGKGSSKPNDSKPTDSKTNDSDGSWGSSNTMRVDEPDSDRESDRGDSNSTDSNLAGNDSSQTMPRTSTNDPNSQTLGFDSGTHGRSDRIDTPPSREITGLSSGQTVPRGTLGEGHASQSLRPGDSLVFGPENVRLRAHRIAAEAKGGEELDYQVVSEVGKGGMGVIHKSSQRSLDRTVAIKRIKGELAASDSDRNKFISEAVITGQLEHPNIVPVHDLGLASDGLPFYAMKLLEGEEWEDAIKRLSEEENLNILIQVAQAIAFAHSRNILHRDLKPANVWIGSFGEVLVLDWGLAARLGTGEDIPPSGTPVYMPPETALEYLDLAKNRMAKRSSISSTRRIPQGTYSDIYLLGGLLFKIVTGRAPHRGKSTFECLKNAAKNRIIEVKRRSELLDIAYKALQTDPAKRHRTVLEFIDDIKDYQAHAQSVTIAKKATKELRTAEKSQDTASATDIYGQLAGAQHGFQNALELWPGNRRADRRLQRTRKLYAETAFRNGDYDLSLSLLDHELEDDKAMIADVQKSQKERNRRVALFRTLQYGVAAALVVAMGFIGLSVYFGMDAIQARNNAQLARDETDQVKQEAQQSIAKADQAVAAANQQVTVAEGQVKEAETKVALANTKVTTAEQKVAAAEIKVAEADTKVAAADVKVLAADKTVAAAVQESNQKKYEAAIAQVQADLALKGQYAGWKTFEALRKLPAVKERQGIEWETLKAATRWQEQATELFANKRAPLLATSSDGKTLAIAEQAAGKGTTLQVFATAADALAGKPTAQQSISLAGSCDQIAMSPKGEWVAVVSAGRLMLFDARRGNKLTTPATAAITTVAFHPQENRLLMGSNTTDTVEWQIDGGSVREIDTDDRWHQRPITTVGYSQEGSLRFSTDSDGVIQVWRGDGEQRERWPFRHSRVANGDPHITAAAMAGIDQGGQLAYGCEDGAVYVLTGPWSKDAEAADSERPTIAQVSLQTPTGQGWLEDAPDRLPQLHLGPVMSVALAEQGRTVVSSGGEQIFVRSAQRDQAFDWQIARTYHDAKLRSCVIAVEEANIPMAYSADESGRVVKWKIRVPKSENEKAAPAGELLSGITAVDYDPNSQALVVADASGFLRQWPNVANTRDLGPQALVVGHSNHNQMQAWHIDGTKPTMVTIAADRLACVWDAHTGTLLRQLPLGEPQAIALSADNKQLLLSNGNQGKSLDKQAPIARAIGLDGSAAVELWDEQPRVSVMHSFQRPGDATPTLAIGLRDGQVYLWNEQTGRTELVGSGNRPHWRPIRSFAFDTRTGSLYSGDNEGLVARWSIGTSVATRPIENFLQNRGAPVIKLEVSRQGTLLAVQEDFGSIGYELLNAATLKPTRQVAASAKTRPRGKLQDVTFNQAGDQLLGLFQTSSKAATIQRAAVNNPAWQMSDLTQSLHRSIGAKQPMQHLSQTTTGKLLISGPGVVCLLDSTGEQARLLSLVRSRTPVSFVSMSADDHQLVTLTKNGRLDAWATNSTATPNQQTPNQQWISNRPQQNLIACQGSQPGEVYLGKLTPRGGTTVERWNLADQTKLGELGTLTAGKCVAMAACENQNGVACAMQTETGGRIDFILPGKPIQSIPLPAGSLPQRIAIDSQASQMVVVLRSGKIVYASPDAAGRWQTQLLPQTDATIALFASGGERLLVGTEAGQVLVLKIDRQAETLTARTMLTLAGHSAALSAIDLTSTPAGEQTLISGDTAGRVLLRTLTKQL